MFKAAPVESLTIPKSTKVNGVLGVGKLALTSAVKPVTATPYNLPLFKPALSTSEPVLVLVPIYI